MSTNAIIGKLQADGTVRSVYLHHDGYFSHAGRILRTFYRCLLYTSDAADE